MQIPVKIQGIKVEYPNDPFIKKLLTAYEEKPVREFNIRTRKSVYVGKDLEATPLYQYDDKSGRIISGLGSLLFLNKQFEGQPSLFNITEISPKRKVISTEFEVPEKMESSSKFRVNGRERDYFHESLDLCRKNNLGFIKLPTGAGKTEIQLTLAYNQAKILGRGLILVPQVQIKEQFIKRAKLYDISISDYTELTRKLKYDSVSKKSMSTYLEVDSDEIPNIIITTPQVLLNDIQEKRYVDLHNTVEWIITDECHHSSCDTWVSILLNLSKVYRCHGFSALPISEKSSNATQFNQIDSSDAMSIAVNGNILYQKSACDLREFLNLPILINYHYSWVGYSEYKRSEVEWNSVYRLLMSNENRSLEISGIIDLLTKLEYLSITHVSRKDQGFNLLKGVHNNKTLCWYGGGTQKSGGKFYTTDNDKVKRLEKFKSEDIREVFGEKITNLIGSSVLIEGLDMDAPLNALVLTEGKSDRMSTQKVGRIVRPSNRKSVIINFIDDNVRVLSKQSTYRTTQIKKEFDCKPHNVWSIKELETLLLDINEGLAS